MHINSILLPETNAVAHACPGVQAYYYFGDLLSYSQNQTSSKCKCVACISSGLVMDF